MKTDIQYEVIEEARVVALQNGFLMWDCCRTATMHEYRFELIADRRVHSPDFFIYSDGTVGLRRRVYRTLNWSNWIKRYKAKWEAKAAHRRAQEAQRKEQEATEERRLADRGFFIQSIRAQGIFSNDRRLLNVLGFEHTETGYLATITYKTRTFAGAPLGDPVPAFEASFKVRYVADAIDIIKKLDDNLLP